MNKMWKWFPMVAILLQVTLPTKSQESYTCDISYETTCIMESIDNLSDWNFDVEDVAEEVDELKFILCNFFEVSTTVSISDNSISIVDLSGNHIQSLFKFNFTIDHLLVANLSRNEIENLNSSSIFEGHPTLQKIDLSFNRIACIHSEAFNGLIDLEELFLNHNGIKEVNEFMFVPLVQLKRLELSANSIENLDNPFAVLTNLQKLNLEKNNFSEFNFNILESNNLSEISLGNNNDTFLSLTGEIIATTNVTLSEIIQSNLTAHGRSVSITNSKISILTIVVRDVENIVARNSSITELIYTDTHSAVRVGDFSKNLLTGHLSFEMWHNLEILDLSFNQIQNVSFVNCSLMTALNLSHNNLTFIQNLTSLSNMKILDLSFNCIENFELNTFGGMQSLEVLSLRQTCFKSLDYGTFSFQTKLRVLDISFNNLNSVDLDLLAPQTNLEDFFIDGNDLTDLPSMNLIENYFPKLQSMGLTHNKWNCKALSSLINKLYQLSIKLFVEQAVQHTSNVRGIGCTTTLFNSTKETLIIPNSPMPIKHTMYMKKIEEINEIVRTVNDLKENKNYREILDNAIERDMKDLQRDKSAIQSILGDQINQLKTFGEGIVNKFKSLNDINFNKLMKMKQTIEKLNETNNEKYELISESVKSLKDKLKLIKLNKENRPENVNKMAMRDEIKVHSDYYDDIGSLKALEIFLIVLLVVLSIVALYYALVYY